MKIWSLPKHENLSTGKKNCGKEEKLLNFSSFPQYFQYISNLKRPIHIFLLNVVNRIIFSWTLQIWYVEVRIYRSISESPLEFEITRVDCSEKNKKYTGNSVQLQHNDKRKLLSKPVSILNLLKGASSFFLSDTVITKIRLFKYIETFLTTKGKHSDKKVWYFSYSCSKHRLWVLVWTASTWRF